MRNSDWSSDVGSSDLASPSPPSWPAPTSRPNSAQPSSPKSRGSAPRRLPRAPPFPNCSPVSHPVPTTAEPPYLRALNEPQREAVLTTEGPVPVPRSEERGVGKEGVGSGIFRRSPSI